jgi:hypothetical protein
MAAACPSALNFVHALVPGGKSKSGAATPTMVCRIGFQLLAPNPVTDHRRTGGVAGLEAATENRRIRENPKELSRGRIHTNRYGQAVASHDGGLVRKTIRRGEHRAAPLVHGVDVRRHDGPHRQALRIERADSIDLLGAVVRERTQQHLIDDAEDRGRRA